MNFNEQALMKPSTIVFWDYQHSQFYFEEEILASLLENSVDSIPSSKPYSFLHSFISHPIREHLLSTFIQSSSSHFIFHVGYIPKADTSNSLIKTIVFLDDYCSEVKWVTACVTKSIPVSFGGNSWSNPRSRPVSRRRNRKEEFSLTWKSSLYISPGRICSSSSRS